MEAKFHLSFKDPTVIVLFNFLHDQKVNNLPAIAQAYFTVGRKI